MCGNVDKRCKTAARDKGARFRSRAPNNVRPPTEAALRFVLAQQLAGLLVEEVQSGAGRAGDRLILVFGRGLVIVQPLLDLHRCCRAGEEEMSHRLSTTAP